MPSTILSRTISSVVDKRIVLANSQFARPFSIASWTKLRIGLRLIMNNTGATITTPRLFVGLSAGSTNLIMDATTDNWCGVATQGSWSYYAGGFPAAPVEYYGYNMRATKRVGSTLTDNTSSITGDASLPADATTADRTVIFVDITRGSPNYTFQVQKYRNVDAASVDVSLATFLAKVEEATPTISSHGAGTAKTLAVDESGGAFDHVNIGWDKASPTIEICDLAIVKLT